MLNHTRWRYPSLSIHSISNAVAGQGAGSAIPCKLVGKFSIRAVPDMDVEKVTKLIIDHVETEFTQLKTKNELHIECVGAFKWWAADSTHWNYAAASKGVSLVAGQPNLIREGGRYGFNSNQAIGTSF